MLDINTEKLQEVSNYISLKHEEYVKEITMLYALLEELATYWEGPDKEYFTREVLNCKKGYENLGNLVKDYATLLGDVSLNYQNLITTVQENASKL